MASRTPGFVGERLKQSREAHGLTITGLAEMIGVSKQAVSQYEKGADSPRDAVFDRICSLFHHEPHFFLRPVDPDLVAPIMFYRSMASATKTARLKAEARQTWIRELVQYLSEYVDFPVVVFPQAEPYPGDPNLLSMDDAESAASELRALWNLGDGPIVNLLRVMEHNGALVLRHPLDAEALDGLSGWAYPEMLPFVLLNSDKDCAVRSRLDLAHELGHLVLHRRVAPSVLHKQEMFKLIEDQAFRFGAALLLPEKSFLADLYSISLDALKVLKKKWKVSIGMMIERLKHIGVIDAEQHRRLRINYVARKWTRQEPFDGEIPIEQPSTIPTALRVIVSEGIQTIEQVCVNSGFSEHWLRALMGAPDDLFSPSDVGLKVIPFKRRA
jgi:Zn-dependent peptidase ImmA (M78 family)/DNA-binding XRE family transcriptional regulator